MHNTPPPAAQPTSPLLRLPPELRNRIYHFVFSGYKIWIIHGRPTAALFDDSYDPFARSNFIKLCAPTLTCRQIYAETRLLPYKYSMYVFTYGHWFIKWLNGLEDAVQAIVWDRVGDLAKEAVFAQGYKPKN